LSIGGSFLAGRPTPKPLLVDAAKLLAACVDLRPDLAVPALTEH